MAKERWIPHQRNQKGKKKKSNFLVNILLSPYLSLGEHLIPGFWLRHQKLHCWPLFCFIPNWVVNLGQNCILYIAAISSLHRSALNTVEKVIFGAEKFSVKLEKAEVYFNQHIFYICHILNENSTMKLWPKSKHRAAAAPLRESGDFNTLQPPEQESSRYPNPSHQEAVWHLPRAGAPKDTSLPESWGAGGSGARQCTRTSWCGWAGSARPEAADAAPARGSSGPASAPGTRSDQKCEEGDVEMLHRL